MRCIGELDLSYERIDAGFSYGNAKVEGYDRLY
jgi:hypothetical protein